jgi:hypothetical protein
LSKKVGKYQGECLHLQEATEADFCAVFVHNGVRGSGFSSAHNFEATERKAMLCKLADVMEFLAAEMRREAGVTAIN